MKPPRTDRENAIIEQWWTAIVFLIVWGFAVFGLSLLAGCGGTFTLSPTGELSYTTPQILKAPIVHEK